MNNARRIKLSRAIDYLGEAMDWVQQAATEEQEAFDNLPDAIAMSDRGDTMEWLANRLDEVYGNIEDQINELDDIINT